MLISINTSQRIASFIAAASLLLLLIFHGPWTGYETQRYVPPVLPGSSGILLDIGFFEYHTREPLLPWFSSIQNFLVACIFITMLYALFMWLFRDKSET